MVSSIVPGAAGANALGVDPRLPRPGAQTTQWRDAGPEGDRVELSGAVLAASRESVRAALAQVEETLALGGEAQAMLLKAQGLAGADAQADLDALLAAYGEAAAGREGLSSGDDIVVQAEPGAQAMAIAGVDLRLGGAIVSLGPDARADDPALRENAQRALDALQNAMSRLADAARALAAHQGFLGAAETAAGVRGDLDADTARLMALQVRQGLEEAGIGAIANVEPKAVLALFKA
jgi:hypothetical protein